MVLRRRITVVRVFLGMAGLVGAATLISAPKSPFTNRDKAYYADPALINYVRPGLVVKVLSGEIAADGTIKTRVRFTDPKGVPLDREGIQTPGVIAASAIAAYIPKGEAQYVAYTTRVQVSPINNRTAVQASTDSGGTWQKVADGEYTYTFRTKAPANFDKTATHAIGVYANRDLTEFDLGTAVDDSVLPFAPDGVSKVVTRDVIRTQSCQRCHVDTFAFHGATGRTSVEMCALCHTPQTVDPDTGNTVDLPVMIHKIHMGADLPSVVKGGKYQIIGFGQSVNDYSDIEIPTDKRNCTVCHEQTTGAAQAQNYLTRPTRAGCGSCHDNVNFINGDDHAGLAQANDTQCSQCHKAGIGEEFDITIPGAHVIPVNSKALGGINWAIVKVDDGAAGKRPTVTFTLKDNAGNPLAPADFARLFAVLAGPTTDYTTKFAGQTTSGYVSEDLSRATGSGGTYSYTFATAIPDKATGTFSISLEGRRLQTIYDGLKKQQSVQYGAKNVVYYFSVDNSPVEPRRKVVAIEKCLACHVSLRLHGENRVDNIEHCVVCHNPVETDAARRPASEAPVASVDFRQLIHSIHGGEALKAFYNTEDYVIYGFGGTKNSFSEVKYPGRLASCDACHVNNSQMLPLPASNSMVANPRGYITSAGPATAACLSCHRSKEAASHAMANTTNLGESCGACHGASGDFSVAKAHAAASVPVVAE